MILNQTGVNTQFFFNVDNEQYALSYCHQL